MNIRELYSVLCDSSKSFKLCAHTHAPLQLVDHPLTHPQDLEDIDQTLYHTLTTLQDEIIDGWFVFIPKINYRVFFIYVDMELSFTTTLQCPWTNQTVDVPLREGGQNIAVTKGNIVSGCWVRRFCNCFIECMFKLEDYAQLDCICIFFFPFRDIFCRTCIFTGIAFAG